MQMEGACHVVFQWLQKPYGHHLEQGLEAS